MPAVRHLGAFPFCPPDVGADFIGAYWRMGVSLPKSMRWYWRVKRWSISAAWDHADNGAGSFSFDAQPTYYGEAEYTPSSEQELVCGRFGMLRMHQVTDDYECLVMLFGGGQVGYEAVRYGGLIYPGMTIYYNAGASLAASYDGAGMLTLDGEPLGCQVSVGTISATLGVSPLEWWPYDPGDGLGPIYDSTTGAQLRAFPSL